MANTKKDAPAFETSINKLEDLITKMESGEMSLADSLKAFEEGISLSRNCQQAISDAELKVQKLVEENGSLTEKALDIEE